MIVLLAFLLLFVAPATLLWTGRIIAGVTRRHHAGRLGVRPAAVQTGGQWFYRPVQPLFSRATVVAGTGETPTDPAEPAALDSGNDGPWYARPMKPLFRRPLRPGWRRAARSRPNAAAMPDFDQADVEWFRRPVKPWVNWAALSRSGGRLPTAP